MLLQLSPFVLLMYFSDITKKIDGQADAPAQLFQKVIEKITFHFSVLNSHKSGGGDAGSCH